MEGTVSTTHTAHVCNQNNPEQFLRDIVSHDTTFIRRILLKLGVHLCDVDDVAQEVLLGVSRALPRAVIVPMAGPREAVRTWLYGICRRQAANLRRRAGRRPEVLVEKDELDRNGGRTEHAEDEWLRAEEERALEGLLRTLAPERRDVIAAYDFDEQPMREVAVTLGIPENTAWNRRRLAIRDLRAAWERRLAARPQVLSAE